MSRPAISARTIHCAAIIPERDRVTAEKCHHRLSLTRDRNHSGAPGAVCDADPDPAALGQPDQAACCGRPVRLGGQRTGR
jgi:hypothetical protein